MILGRTVWTREGGAWRSDAVGAGPDPASKAVPGLLEALCIGRGRRAAVVFEPEGMAHPTVETPRVKRAVFASLERIRSEHPVVSSETLGWGIDPPEPGPGGAFCTQIHCELTPGLLGLRDACPRSGFRLGAAWPAFTVAASCVASRPEASARFVLLLTPDFTAVAACGVRRSFRAWTGRMADRDWREAFALMGGADGRLGRPRDGEPRRGAIVAVAAGDPALICPAWDELRGSGRVEAVLDLDAFAAAALRLPGGHPANLVEAFPRKLDLDGGLAAAGIAGILAATALGAAAAAGAARFGDERANAALHMGALRDRLRELEGHQREMARLRDEVPERPGIAEAGSAALSGLAAAIPDALTLTSFSLGPGGRFELEAMVVGTGFDPEGTRAALARCGFAPAEAGGWSYDAATRQLKVRGSFTRIQP